MITTCLRRKTFSTDKRYPQVTFPPTAAASTFTVAVTNLPPAASTLSMQEPFAMPLLPENIRRQIFCLPAPCGFWQHSSSDAPHTATDKRIMITVGSTLAMLFFASAGGKTSSFVTEGTLWEKEGSCIRLDNGRFILSQGTDICDNWHLFLGQRVYVYRYDDIYFASGEKFSPATLAYTETIPNFTGLYLVCWLCAMALGYWTYATAEEKLKHRRLFAR